MSARHFHLQRIRDPDLALYSGRCLSRERGLPAYMMRRHDTRIRCWRQITRMRDGASAVTWLFLCSPRVQP